LPEGRGGKLLSDIAYEVEDAAAVLSMFRWEFYGCLTARADDLFELTDAVLCADGLALCPFRLLANPLRPPAGAQLGRRPVARSRFCHTSGSSCDMEL